MARGVPNGGKSHGGGEGGGWGNGSASKDDINTKSGRMVREGAGVAQVLLHGGISLGGGGGMRRGGRGDGQRQIRVKTRQLDWG